MRLTTSIESWAARLLLALTVAPVIGCGSVVESSATSSSGSSSSSGAALVCDNPQPYLTSKDSGYERCTGGLVHRREALACPTLDVTLCDSGTGTGAGGSGACATNADCTDGLNGVCEKFTPCQCAYGCMTDADCASGQSCVCDPDRPSCVSSTCKSDADCGGSLCALETIVDINGCPVSQQLACLTSAGGQRPLSYPQDLG